MATKLLLRRAWRQPILASLQGRFLCTSSDGVAGGEEPLSSREQPGRWLTLPPFSPTIDPSTVGRELIQGRSSYPPSIESKTTILKWVRRCCPGVPLNLVQKLFRLRQVRKQATESEVTCLEKQAQKVKRVSPDEIIGNGDVILLPKSVQEFLPESEDYSLNEDEINYVRSLEIYKDSSIIVVNKPHGLPVQGGNGIKISMDMLAAASLRYDYREPPKLVHRLDRDSSGILVLGRTATSTSILHSLFREKTFGASSEMGKPKRSLQKKYWALVIGMPKRPSGVISAPLAKIIVDNGRSERLTISKSLGFESSQSAITEYQVIGSSSHGLTWLELCPLTGRKHQLRVHCAEGLGTPIVGDVKYGWLAQRKWTPLPSPTNTEKNELLHRSVPFGLGNQGGSAYDKQPNLHLHCREMTLPNISMATKFSRRAGSICNFSRIGSLNLVAPLPYHMQRSWDILDH